MENTPSSSSPPAPHKKNLLGKAARAITLSVALAAASCSPANEDLSAVKKDGCPNYPNVATLLESDEAKFDEMYEAEWQKQGELKGEDRRWHAVSAMEKKLKTP